MSPGIPRRAPRRAAPRSTIRANGGFTFAEDPTIAAPQARIIWHADVDPDTLLVTAVPAAAGDPDSIDPAWLDHWLTLVVARDGRQHGVLSDGHRRIRFDVEEGWLADGEQVILHYRLHGVESAARRLLPLRRLLRLVRDRRFPVALFPADARARRGVALLRVRDALDDHATIREIARVFFGDENMLTDKLRHSDSMRARIRRLTREARILTKGGYRELLGPSAAAGQSSDRS